MTTTTTSTLAIPDPGTATRTVALAGLLAAGWAFAAYGRARIVPTNLVPPDELPPRDGAFDHVVLAHVAARWREP